MTAGLVNHRPASRPRRRDPARRQRRPLGGDDRGPDRLRAVGRHAAAAGGADHRDAELAAERCSSNNVTAPLISQAPVTMTVTVPCDVIRAMPPAGGLVLGTAPKDGKQAALNALFVNVNTSRVDITDRNVVVASVPRAQVVSPGLSAHRDHVVGGGHVRDVRRADRPDDGQATLRSGFADPNLRPAIVGVFTDLTGPAPPGLSAVGGDRHPVLHHANGFEARRDGRWRSSRPSSRCSRCGGWTALDGRRMHRLIPPRWRTFSAGPTSSWSAASWCGTSSAPTPPTTATSCRWPASPATPATCRTTSAGSAAPRTRSAGTTTCWR